MKEKLFSALTALAARKYGSEEGNEMLSSFIKKTMTIEATFVSNERTLCQPLRKKLPRWPNHLGFARRKGT